MSRRPFIRAVVKKVGKWGTLRAWTKSSFPVRVLRRLMGLLNEFLKGLLLISKTRIKKDLARIPERKLPIRTIERDDLMIKTFSKVEELPGATSPGGSESRPRVRAFVGVPKTKGKLSGQNLVDLFNVLEIGGIIKKITERSRIFLMHRGLSPPKGAKYFMLSPVPVFGKEYEHMIKDVIPGEMPKVAKYMVTFMRRLK